MGEKGDRASRIDNSDQKLVKGRQDAYPTSFEYDKLKPIAYLEPCSCWSMKIGCGKRLRKNDSVATMG